MTQNEIKKALYLEKPTAKMVSSVGVIPTGTNWRYVATLESGHVVEFLIPTSEMGEKPFDTQMPAQLLIRWMVDYYVN
jgi:hypothetical protein